VASRVTNVKRIKIAKMLSSYIVLHYSHPYDAIAAGESTANQRPCNSKTDRSLEVYREFRATSLNDNLEDAITEQLVNVLINIRIHLDLIVTFPLTPMMNEIWLRPTGKFRTPCGTFCLDELRQKPQ
jgi:hypothetical protein